MSKNKTYIASRANKIPTNAICSMSLKNSRKHSAWFQLSFHRHCHRIRMQMPSEEITFTAWPKIKSQSQIFRYGHSIFCLPYRPKISDFFNLRLHWVSIVRRHFHSCTVAFPLCFDGKTAMTNILGMFLRCFDFLSLSMFKEQQKGTFICSFMVNILRT